MRVPAGKQERKGLLLGIREQAGKRRARSGGESHRLHVSLGQQLRQVPRVLLCTVGVFSSGPHTPPTPTPTSRTVRVLLFLAPHSWPSMGGGHRGRSLVV